MVERRQLPGSLYITSTGLLWGMKWRHIFFSSLGTNARHPWTRVNLGHLMIFKTWINFPCLATHKIQGQVMGYGLGPKLVALSPKLVSP